LPAAHQVLVLQKIPWALLQTEILHLEPKYDERYRHVTPANYPVHVGGCFQRRPGSQPVTPLFAKVFD
jgi:hypothetical protein